MLEAMRRSKRWLMWIVIIGVGLVFTVFVGAGSPTLNPSAASVVQVADWHFGPRDVDRVRRVQEEEYRRALGDSYDSTAASAQLDALAANILVGQALRATEAQELGIAVSDAEVRDFVKRSLQGATDESGRLRTEDIRYYAESEFGTERRFVELVRMDLLAQKLQRLFAESLTVSDQEAREALLHRQEEVSIAFVALDTTDETQPLEVTEADVAALLTEDEPRVRERYQEQLEKYERAEAVRVRHILFQVAKDASEEEVTATLSRAEATRDRIREGAAFVDVALEMSEDEGSQAEGGDLGFVERGGQIDPALEEAAFALEVGGESDPVRTDDGFHLLRVEEKREAGSVPFEDVKDELARETIQLDRARARAWEQAEALSSAVAEGESLVDAARAADLSLERPSPLRRRPDGIVPGLGAVPEILTAAFTLSEEQPASPRIFQAGRRLVLLELLERETPSEEEIEAQIPEERERLRNAQVAQLSQSWLDARRTELTEEGQIVYDLTLLQ
jgi:peptidyl-prolyl cis-trans isomerase D